MMNKTRGLSVVKFLITLLVLVLSLSLTACFSEEEAEPTAVEEPTEEAAGGGPTASITLAVDPDTIPADGSSSCAIRATLRDAAGKAVATNTSVTFSATLGTFPNGETTYTVTTPDENGIVTVSLIAGTTPGTAVITCQSNNVTQLIQVKFTHYSIRLTAEPESIPADGVSSSTITAEVKDAGGSPVPPDTPIAFSTTLGHFLNGTTTSTVETPDESGVVSVYLISGTTIGEAIVTAQSNNVTQTVAVFFTGEGIPGQTAWITLTANPNSLPADGASSSAITATLKDSGGLAVPRGTEVTFSTTYGTFLNGETTYTVTTPDEKGTVTTSLIAGTVSGTAFITASSQNVTQSVTVEFTGAAPGPGNTASITLTATPNSIPADGASSSAITATLKDNSGAPVATGTIVTFSTTLGSFPNFSTIIMVQTPDDSGTVTTSLIAGTIAGTATVTASSNNITQGVTVELESTGPGPGPGNTASITLSATPDTIPADGTSSSAIKATLTDDTGSPVAAGTVVTFSTTLGTFPNTSTTYMVETPDDTGTVTVSLIAGTFSGIATVTATSWGVSQSVTVEFSGEDVPAMPYTLSLALSQATVQSDNSDKATITATVLDINNAVIEGVMVSFTSDGGQLSTSSQDTDQTGVARTDFSSGTTNRSNRIITITATVAGLPARQIPVQVVGTTLTLSTNATILEIGGNDTATLTITARDASLVPIYDALITLTSSPVGKVQITPSGGNTNVTGKLQVQVRALAQGDVVVQASGLGATATQNYTVGTIGAVFGIIHPTADPFSWNTTAGLVTTGTLANISFNDNSPAQDTITRAAGDFTADGFAVDDEIMVVGSASNDGTYTIANAAALTLTLVPSDQLVTELAGASVVITTGVLVRVTAPAPMATVQFATTLGGWNGLVNMIQDVPVAAGQAEAVLISDEAGTANILVSDKGNPSTSDSVTVVFSAPSSQAAKISLQASATVVAPSTGGITNSITLTATVKNATDQVVGGAPVAFSIENPTGGGEYVSPPIVYTNAYGIAEATFTSGSLSTDAEGVTVKALLVDSPLIDDTIAIVIGGTAGSVVITPGTTIESINNDTAYRLPMSVLVADSNGNPMTNTIVSLSAWPISYAQGCWVEDPVSGDWNPDADCSFPITPLVFLPNEDDFWGIGDPRYRNLILDPGEDIGPPPGPDFELTPPNSAAGTVPATVVTDENGVATFNLVYLKASAAWIADEITASTLVYGTETKGTYRFALPWLQGEEPSLPHSPYN